MTSLGTGELPLQAGGTAHRDAANGVTPERWYGFSSKDSARKLAAAGLVFLAIVGAWSFLQIRQRHQATLPNAGAYQEDCTIWFVGSSSIHKWTTLDHDMQPWVSRNRGIDGAMMKELGQRFANEDAQPPEAIVYYAGENDIAHGATAQAAFSGLQQFMEIKQQKYGDLPVLVLSLKPSPTRWKNLPIQTSFNSAARQLAAVRGDLVFVDIVPLLLKNARPGPFYQSDGIHMNSDGYALWAGAVRKALSAKLPHQLIDRCMGAGAEKAAKRNAV